MTSSNNDDEDNDQELLSLLRASLGLNSVANTSSEEETGVLSDAEYIYNQSIDVALDSRATKAAAETIWNSMRDKEYSTKIWSTHELHPSMTAIEDTDDENAATVDFIFTMDLLNFCFWSDTKTTTKQEKRRFQVEYRGKTWTGYWSLVAALRRAVDEGMWVEC